MSEKDKEAEEERELCKTHGLTNSKPKKWEPNWKQIAVFVVANLIFAGLYKHYISKYSVIICIALAGAFNCFAIFVSYMFRDKKQKEYIPERKKSCSDDSKREANNKQIETLRVNP